MEEKSITKCAAVFVQKQPTSGLYGDFLILTDEYCIQCTKIQEHCDLCSRIKICSMRFDSFCQGSLGDGGDKYR